MKRVGFLLVALFFMSAIYAQRSVTWVSIGLKGGYGSSMLLNTNALADENIDMQYYNPSYTVGGKLAFFVNDNMGLSLEGLYGTFGQQLTITDASNTWSKNLAFSAWNIDVLLKMRGNTGFYVEVGPQFTNLISATNNAASIMDNVNKATVAAVLGVGLTPVFTKKVEISIGLRATYGLGSITIPEYDIFRESPNSLAYDSFANPVTLVPMVDFSYVFGYMGRASCGKFRFMFNK